MARKRLVRNRMRKKSKKSFEVDITSLLDILVILLVFLLKSYSASNVILNIPENITLPNSTSQAINTDGVVIQVSPDKIWVDDEEVLSSSNSKTKIYDENGQRIIALFNELMTKKANFKLLTQATQGQQPFTGIVNLIVDKKVKYSYLKKLLYTCASAGFKQYKFVVLGQE